MKTKTKIKTKPKQTKMEKKNGRDWGRAKDKEKKNLGS
jgi:hypothetical protein